MSEPSPCRGYSHSRFTLAQPCCCFWPPISSKVLGLIHCWFCVGQSTDGQPEKQQFGCVNSLKRSVFPAAFGPTNQIKGSQTQPCCIANAQPQQWMQLVRFLVAPSPMQSQWLHWRNASRVLKTVGALCELSGIYKNL